MCLHMHVWRASYINMLLTLTEEKLQSEGEINWIPRGEKGFASKHRLPSSCCIAPEGKRTVTCARMGKPRFLHPLQGVSASQSPEGPQVFSSSSSSSTSPGDKFIVDEVL